MILLPCVGTYLMVEHYIICVVIFYFIKQYSVIYTHDMINRNIISNNIFIPVRFG